jgi:heme-degrading monooxygenase HmoA
MQARVNTFEGPPEGLEASMADVREHILPACEAIPGFTGMVVLVDRTTGRSLAITFWESEAALRESEKAASKIRTESADGHRERVVSVERFEVPVATLQAQVGVG